MFKTLIAPVQAWLLSQGKCVGCGTRLDSGQSKDDVVICKCSRIYKKDGDIYRRARLDEVR